MVKRFADQSALISLAGGMEYHPVADCYRQVAHDRLALAPTGSPRNGEPPRVRCCKIDNTWYISAKEIARFWDRAEAGEFEGEFSGVCAEKQAV